MNYPVFKKPCFSVIGKVGSTDDGNGFIMKLWESLRNDFDKLENVVLKGEDGLPIGIWGVMTNFNFEFKPWEDDFSRGLYLAGVEAKVDSIAPPGFKKWIVPGFEYLKVPKKDGISFREILKDMEKAGFSLVGAIQDYEDPRTNESFMLFPIASDNSKEILIKEQKSKVNQIAYCGFCCDTCFLTKWCGGCRGACNMCSYATLSNDNRCENEKCASTKGLEYCAFCDDLEECRKGFFSSPTGHVTKAYSIYIRDHGIEAHSNRAKELLEENRLYDLDETKNLEEALNLLNG